MFRRKRKGVSTILGTLIFIGILFTSVIPMMLVMNQADTLYEQKKLEIGRFDEERAREQADVYVYPTDGSTSQYLTIKVTDRCELAMRIVRIWINDTIYPADFLVLSMESKDLGSYNVDPKNGSEYDIEVTSERGNVYENGGGTMSYIDDHWVVENLLINVLISESGVVFKIYLYIKEGESWTQIDYVQVWKIGGSAFKCFDVTGRGSPHDYKVTVKRGSSIIHEEEVLMNWPAGPPVIWVYS
jgi:hypothetical protein